MRVSRLQIENFRGIKKAELHFSGHTLLIGGNNVSKSTICEALDLALGPDRLNRTPPVEESDFRNAGYPGGALMRAQPFTRSTLIAAVELLEGHSQARSNQMVLCLGLEDQIGSGTAVSDEDHSTFRLHIVLVTARTYLRRLYYGL
ncbi:MULTISPECIES: AAA family ATPase [Burkholderia]|uniref:AAA family ATPase n=1 Tax=Burkholderia TaxID=32008 RepID=UPI000705F81A|nr:MULTISPECIES: AAA family ATPase [Burkholderia]ALK31119.1 ATP-dependent endonuclease family protein [Burkholderia plantarii]